MDRQTTITNIKNDPHVSVLIIGAGINGAGTFRDLTLNGVKTLLIDRGDFCSGASSASSHMAHGGIRYLENGEFKLVREAVNERNRMIRNAPHIVTPLPTTIPIFKFWSGLLNAPLKFLGLLDKPSERGALIIKLGLIMYDAYAGGSGVVPKHTFRGRKATQKLIPKFHPDIKYSATYYDGSILSPERYTVELVLDAEAEGDQAKAINYLSFFGARGNQIQLRDELSEEIITITADLIINAAGPWIDIVNKGLGVGRRYIGGTKGSHLVLNNPELSEAIGNNEIFFENKDGRIVLIFPLKDKVMIGTSDLPIEDADTARCEEAEIEYFMEMTKIVFPNIAIAKDQIEYRFSGVRPLEHSQSRSTSQITRDHSIKVDDLNGVPVYSLVGGKWTSYRAFSEQVTNKALAFFGKARAAETTELPVGGGKGYAAARQNKATDLALFEKYGSRCALIQDRQVGGATPLTHNAEYTKEEIEFLIEEEKVTHLDDLILRRTLLAYLGKLRRSLLEELADICAEVLGWDNERKQSEIAHTIQVLKNKHGIEV